MNYNEWLSLLESNFRNIGFLNQYHDWAVENHYEDLEFFIDYLLTNPKPETPNLEITPNAIWRWWYKKYMPINIFEALKDGHRNPGNNSVLYEGDYNAEKAIKEAVLDVLKGIKNG